MSVSSQQHPLFSVSPVRNSESVAAFYEGYNAPPPLPTFGSSQNLLQAVDKVVNSAADGDAVVPTASAPPAPGEKAVRIDEAADVISASLKLIREETASRPVDASQPIVGAAITTNKGKYCKEEGELSSESRPNSPLFTPSNSQSF